MTGMAKSRVTKTPSFEAKMRRLEEIIGELEGGEKPLDDVVAMYEEGIRLSSECLEYLGKTEVRLKKLSRDAAGKFDIAPEEDER
jgi:exodeoxyribonuclease VII small subunit